MLQDFINDEEERVDYEESDDYSSNDEVGESESDTIKMEETEDDDVDQLDESSSEDSFSSPPIGGRSNTLQDSEDLLAAVEAIHGHEVRSVG